MMENLPNVYEPQFNKLQQNVAVEERAEQIMWFFCSHVKIGTFNVRPSGNNRRICVAVNHNCMQFRTQTTDNADQTTDLILRNGELQCVISHFCNNLPVIFIVVTPVCAENIRRQLHMTKGSLYLDPDSRNDHHRAITLLVDSISKECQLFVIDNFSCRQRYQLADHDLASDLLARYSNIDPKNIFEQAIPAHEISDNSAGPTIMEVLCYPSPGKDGIPITATDLSCLDEGRLFNDVIVDCYLKYMALEKLSEADKSRTHIFNCYFFACLTQKNREAGCNKDRRLVAIRRHNRVQKWTDDVDIFDKNFIIIPINHNSHWTMAVICFPRLVASIEQANGCNRQDNLPLNNRNDANIREDQDEGYEKEPCILYFDSTNSSDRWDVVQILREYLEVEWLRKKHTTCVFSRTSLRGYAAIVPQLESYPDCAVYILQFIESFFRHREIYFSLNIAELDEWFSAENISDKRDDVKNLMQHLVKHHSHSIAAYAGSH